MKNPILILLSLLMGCCLPAAQAQNAIEKDTLEAAQLMLRAEMLIDSVRLPEAMQSVVRAETLLTQHLPGDAALFGHLFTAYGNVYKAMGVPDSAEMYTQKALDIFLEKTGANSALTADARNNLGNIYFETGRYAESEEEIETALSIRKSVYGEQHEKTAESHQNLALPLLRQGKIEGALEHAHRAIDIFQSLPGDHRYQVAEGYANLAPIYQLTADYDSAVKYAQKTLTLFDSLLGPGNLPSSGSYSNIAICLAEKNDFINALLNFNKALNIRRNAYGDNHPELLPMYGNIGQVLSMQGDFDKSLLYTQKAIALATSTLGPDHPATLSLKDMLGACYTQMGEPETAIPLHKEVFEKGKAIFGETAPEQSYVLANLGFAYSIADKNDSALVCYQTALQLLARLLGEDSPELAQLFNNIGNTHFDQKNYPEAKIWLQKANAAWLSSRGPIHSDVAKTYKQLGTIASLTLKPDEAKEFFEKAARSTGFDPAQPQNLDPVVSLPLLAEVFSEQARFHFRQFKTGKKPGDLKESYALIRQMSGIVKAASEKLRTENARQHLAARMIPPWENGIAVTSAYSRYFSDSSALETAFEWIESNRATYLYESLQEQNALGFSGIPSDALDKEYGLRTEIAFQQRKRIEAMAFADEAGVNAVNALLFDLNQQYDALKQRLEAQYPEYYRLKYKTSDPGMRAIQASLAPDQTILSYFVGDSSVFLYAVNRDGYRFFDIKKDYPLEDWVVEMLGGLTEYHLASQKTPELRRTANQKYRRAARALYGKLIAPASDMLRSELIVLPDGALGYLPFEALLSADATDIANYLTYPFLLKKHHVRYCYSTSLLIEMSEKKHKRDLLPGHVFAGFAPWYPGSRAALTAELSLVINDHGSTLRSITIDSIPDLRFSGEEVLRLLDKFKYKGKAWIGAEAKREVFTEHAGRYRILHLSTHGVADDRTGDYAFLIFAPRHDSIQNELLYLRDIYSLSLDADLVVLSACQTALGKLRRGEGIISLARAFAFAGAKSITSTLWSVNDARTKDFMLAFYGDLFEGKDKTEALWQAKMQFAQKDNDYADPYFWSGFILIGDGSKLKMD